MLQQSLKANIINGYMLLKMDEIAKVLNDAKTLARKYRQLI